METMIEWPGTLKLAEPEERLLGERHRELCQVLYVEHAEHALHPTLARVAWSVATGECVDIWVAPHLRRQGLATRLWREAQSLNPMLRHSPHRTIEGQKWATSLGEGPLPTWRLA